MSLQTTPPTTTTSLSSALFVFFSPKFLFRCTPTPPWEILKNSFTVHEHETPIVRLFADLFKEKKNRNSLTLWKPA